MGSITFALERGYAENNQRDDYIITIASTQFAITNRVLVIFDADIVVKVPDCMEWSSSEVRVSKCWMDSTANEMWIHIDHGPGTNYAGASKNLIVKTTN